MKIFLWFMITVLYSCNQVHAGGKRSDPKPSSYEGVVGDGSRFSLHSNTPSPVDEQMDQKSRAYHGITAALKQNRRVHHAQHVLSGLAETKQHSKPVLVSSHSAPALLQRTEHKKMPKRSDSAPEKLELAQAETAGLGDRSLTIEKDDWKKFVAKPASDDQESP